MKTEIPGKEWAQCLFVWWRRFQVCV